MTKCPHCGSEKGYSQVATSFTATHHAWNGEKIRTVNACVSIEYLCLDCAKNIYQQFVERTDVTEVES